MSASDQDTPRRSKPRRAFITDTEAPATSSLFDTITAEAAVPERAVVADVRTEAGSVVDDEVMLDQAPDSLTVEEHDEHEVQLLGTAPETQPLLDIHDGLSAVNAELDALDGDAGAGEVQARGHDHPGEQELPREYAYTSLLASEATNFRRQHDFAILSPAPQRSLPSPVMSGVAGGGELRPRRVEYWQHMWFFQNPDNLPQMTQLEAWASDQFL